jgi:hypothetical protein
MLVYVDSSFGSDPIITRNMLHALGFPQAPVIKVPPTKQAYYVREQLARELADVGLVIVVEDSLESLELYNTAFYDKRVLGLHLLVYMKEK